MDRHEGGVQTLEFPTTRKCSKIECLSNYLDWLMFFLFHNAVSDFHTYHLRIISDWVYFFEINYCEGNQWHTWCLVRGDHVNWLNLSKVSLLGWGRCPSFDKSSCNGVDNTSRLVEGFCFPFSRPALAPMSFSFGSTVSVPTLVRVLPISIIRLIGLKFMNKILQVSEFDEVFNLVFQNTTFLNGVSSVAMISSTLGEIG